MKPRLFIRGWLCAALLAAPGCITLDDLSMPDEDAGRDAQSDTGVSEVDPSSDGGDEPDSGVEAPEADASIHDDASRGPGPMLDGGEMHPSNDAGMMTDGRIDPDPADTGADSQVDTGAPEPSSCDENSDCGADQICAARVCRPKCTAEGACVVYQRPANRTFGHFGSDDRALYFSLYAPQGAVGSQSDGQLWRRVPGQAPTLVTDQISGTYTEFVVHKGYAYFRRGNVFMRKNVDAQSPVESLYTVVGGQHATWAIGDDFIVIGLLDGFLVGRLDGAGALRKIEQPPLSWPVNVFTAGDRFFFEASTKLSDGAEQKRIRSVQAKEPFAVEDASPVRPSVSEQLVEVRPPYAYFRCNTIGIPCRFDMADASLELMVGPLDDGTEGLDFKVVGESVYVFDAVYNDAHTQRSTRVRRYALSDPSVTSVIAPQRSETVSSAGAPLEVVGGRLYTVAGGSATDFGNLIYEMPLPPTSCTNDAQCAQSEVCGPDDVCMPKYDEFGRKVFAVSKSGIAHVASRGEAVYWLTQPSRDALGNARSDAELWVKQANQPATLLVGQLEAPDVSDPQPIIARDDYVYYRSKRTIYRKALSNKGAAEQLYTLPDTGPAKWALGTNFIALGSSSRIFIGSLDGSAILKQVYTGALPADPYGNVMMLGVDDKLWFSTVTETFDSKLSAMRVLEPYTVESFDVQAVEILDVREPYFYGWGTRFDLRDGSATNISRTGAIVTKRDLVVGDWVYSCIVDFFDHSYLLERRSLRDPGTFQTLVYQGGRTDIVSSRGSLAVAGSRLYSIPRIEPSSQAVLGRILYELELPPPPCNADLPCPTGTTCGTDNLCH